MFTVHVIEYAYSKSALHLRTGIEWLDGLCSCGEKWTGGPSADGPLCALRGRYDFTCPRCHVESPIAMR